MTWIVEYLPEVEKDLKSLPPSRRLLARKAIEKVKQNPLPQSEGGYGKPLGHKSKTDLTNLLKVKLRGEGLRIVYKLVRSETRMLIVVIGLREDNEVYELAHRRRTTHGI